MVNVGQVQVDQIVTYLRTVSAITTLLPGGIYFGKTLYEMADGDIDSAVERYCRIDIVSDTSPDDVTSAARLQFTIVGGDYDDATTLISAVEAISNELCQPKFPKVPEMGTFNILQCKSAMMHGPGYDMHDRIVIKKDYIFYYATYGY